MSLYLIISFILHFLIQPTYAVESTASTQTKDIVNLVQQKVKEKLNLINPTSTGPKCFFGSITNINQNQISINFQNTPHIINTDTDTVFVDVKKNKIKITNLKVGQEILAMGSVAEDQSLNTKRIVVTDLKESENPNQITIGKIVDISTSSSILVLIPIKDKNNQYQIHSDSKTEIVDSQNQKVDSKLLTTGKKITAIIKPDAKLAKTFYASKIIISTPTN